MRRAAQEITALEATLEERRRAIDAALDHLAPEGPAPAVVAAVRDSLLAPAKRLRPILALLVAEAVGGDSDAVIPLACAIEMVHTSSLILDDLPCMDDAATRRGRPACHVAHGEAMAILAAFALQSRAFEIVADSWPGAPGAPERLRIAAELARAIGLAGMIGGQSVDLLGTSRDIDRGTVEFIHARKTGSLFTASAAAAAIAVGAPEAQVEAMVGYADKLGRAFQIVDDLIDATAGIQEAGKDVGQDHRKTTFASFAGVEGARALARNLTLASQAALVPLGPRGRTLHELASYVVTRRC
jgi:geranylgeranyl diphosphate synthase, type II